MEKRLLLAFVLSAAILLAWSVIFPPPQRPAAPPEPAPAVETQESVGLRDDTAEPPTAAEDVVAAEVEEPIAAMDEVVEATAEESVDLANGLMDVVISNRGAAVTSYRLLAYDGDDG